MTLQYRDVKNGYIVWCRFRSGRWDCDVTCWYWCAARLGYCGIWRYARRSKWPLRCFSDSL